MSQTTITKRFLVNGVLKDPTSAKLSDATATYGVKRNDTNAVVVVDGTAMTKLSTGVYTYAWTDPAAGLTYTVATEFVYDGETYRVLDTVAGGTGSTTVTPEPETPTVYDTSTSARLERYLQLEAAATQSIESQMDVNGTRYTKQDLDKIQKAIADLQLKLARENNRSRGSGTVGRLGRRPV